MILICNESSQFPKQIQPAIFSKLKKSECEFNEHTFCLKIFFKTLLVIEKDQ